MRPNTRKHAALVPLLVTCAAAVTAAPQDDGGEGTPPDPLVGTPNAERTDPAGLAPAVTGAELRARAEAALQRGFDYLVANQNKDGSWGSHDPVIPELRDFGFQLLNRGSQDGVRLACTGIVVKALLRKEDRSAAEEAALRRAVDALAKTERFAYEYGEAFNTWGYGFKLDALCDLLEADPPAELRARLVAAADVCVHGLKTFQQADGGWNYYAGPEAGGESMSFNTANFAEDLFRARELGIEVPKGMVEDAAKLLQRMITMKGGVVYDARFLLSQDSVNELSSASRTAAVTESLAEMGLVGEDVMLRSLAVFDEGENWLEDGRKLIMPHTAVHQISGYFFFYGYHYLSEFCARLGDAVPRERWERSAWTMVRTQEADGCWWDTPAGHYGDKWGTGFALLTLQRYLKHCPPVPAEPDDPGGEEGER